MINPRPLDSITPAELRRAVEILRDFFHGIVLRFKFIDIYECPKNEVIPYLESERLGTPLSPPNRRARIYFHKHITDVFQKAVVNLTTGDVELLQALPDSQGLVRYL
jgi:Cu2+-containing amine oxidase